MSSVLWANYRLDDGQVVSEEVDKYVLYRHQQKLVKLSRDLRLTDFDSFCDSTDAQVNLGAIELPEGIRSTNELMARDGKWIDSAQAVAMLQGLLEALKAKPQRFGLLKNDYVEIMEELRNSLAFAQIARQNNARFNFSVVM